MPERRNEINAEGDTHRRFIPANVSRCGRAPAKTATWFIHYHVKGKPVRMATGTTDGAEALQILREKIAKAAHQNKYSSDFERVLVDQWLDLVIEDYQFNERGSAYETERRINKHLRPFFGEKRAAGLTTPLIKKYTAQRVREAAAATVNKELAHLRRGFRLGLQHEPPLVARIPHFRMLPVDNARSGIVSYEQYRAIRDALPSHSRIALVIGYHSGARKGEIKKFRLDRIDFKAGRIELVRKTTKNKSPRYLPIYGDMSAELSMAMSLADPTCPFLIQEKGKRVADFNKSRHSACEKAKLDDALFHDLRRTAVTNRIEAGFTEKEAMEISGHKTRSIFDRSRRFRTQAKAAWAENGRPPKKERKRSNVASGHCQ